MLMSVCCSNLCLPPNVSTTKQASCSSALVPFCREIRHILSIMYSVCGSGLQGFLWSRKLSQNPLLSAAPGQIGWTATCTGHRESGSSSQPLSLSSEALLTQYLAMSSLI